MKSNSIKKAFLNLSLSRKIVLIGAILAIIFAFMPWFETNDTSLITSDKPIKINGFGRYGIFGTVSVLFSLTCILILVREALTGKEKTFSFANSTIWMFLAGEAVFALTLGIFVFSTIFDETSEAAFRFGIFLSIFSHILIFGGAHFSFSEEKKIANKKAFRSMSEEDLAKLNLQPEEPDVSNDQLSFGD